MEKEEKFQPQPHHKATLEQNAKPFQREMKEIEMRLLKENLTPEQITELHARQTQLANVFQWMNNIHMLYFPGRIQAPGNNGMKIIDGN